MFGELLTVGARILWTFCLLLALFPSCWVASLSLDGRACAWYYYNLVCYVWSISMGGLLFSGWGTGREVDLEERGAWENWEEWKEGKLQWECVVEAKNEWCHAWWVGLPTSIDMIKTISTVGPRGQPPSFWVILESVKLTKDTSGHVQQDRRQR